MPPNQNYGLLNLGIKSSGKPYWTYSAVNLIGTFKLLHESILFTLTLSLFIKCIEGNVIVPWYQDWFCGERSINSPKGKDCPYFSWFTDKILSLKRSLTLFRLMVCTNKYFSCSANLSNSSLRHMFWKIQNFLFTDRVRSTRGGNVFSLCVSSHLGGGVPTFRVVGGVPTFPGLDGGVPTFPGLDRGGVPTFPGLDGGGGTYFSRSGQGGVPTFPGLDGGGYLLFQVWVGGGYLPGRYPPLPRVGTPPAQGRYPLPLPRVGTPSPLPRVGTPPAQGRYPPPPRVGTPPAQGRYPSAQGRYPPAQGRYPPQGRYPAQGRYPPCPG